MINRAILCTRISRIPVTHFLVIFALWWYPKTTILTRCACSIVTGDHRPGFQLFFATWLSL